MVALVRRVVDRATSELALRRVAAMPGVRLAPGVRFRGAPMITLAPGATLTIGDRTLVVSHAASTPLGLAHPAAIRAERPGAEIVIGADVGMSGGTICAVHRIEVGDGTLLGADVRIVDTDFHPLESSCRRYADIPEPRERDAVRIGRNVFLGTRAIVLKGVEIGDNTVVGAGSVVSGDLPPNSVCAGNPAVVLRTIEMS